MSLNMNVGFIGFGRMGSALAAGAIKSGVVRASKVIVYDLDPAMRAAGKKLKVRVAAGVGEVTDESDLIFLCVKPQGMSAVLSELAASGLNLKKKIFVSIAAGIKLATLEKSLGAQTPCLRVMPNTPALLKSGVSGLSRGKAATPRHEAWVRALLQAVGEVVSVRESMMDGVTAVSGSGPAYVFYLAEAMMEAAKGFGFSDEESRLLVHQTVFGAGTMLKYRTENAGELRRQVTSPGGTTEAAIKEFDRSKLKSIVVRALTKAQKRSIELSQS